MIACEAFIHFLIRYQSDLLFFLHCSLLLADLIHWPSFKCCVSNTHIYLISAYTMITSPKIHIKTCAFKIWLPSHSTHSRVDGRQIKQSDSLKWLDKNADTVPAVSFSFSLLAPQIPTPQIRSKMEPRRGI